MPVDPDKKQRFKTYSRLEAAITLKETRAIKNARKVTRNGKTWHVMTIDGVEHRTRVFIVLADGTEITEPLTKAQRRALRKELGLNVEETE